MSHSKLKICPYECSDYYRYGSCEHEQTVSKRSFKTPSPPNLLKRRGSLPAIWSNVFPKSPPQVPAKLHIPPPTERVIETQHVSWTLTPATNDELLDVHYEMMLRELAIPEKTAKELIKSQSATQKKRMLRLHTLSHRIELENNSKDWVEKFSTLRSQNLTLADLEELVVGLRTANRTTLSNFFSTRGLDKLCDSVHQIAIQSQRQPDDALLLESALRCFEFISRVQIGIDELIDNEEVTLILALCSTKLIFVVENSEILETKKKDVQLAVSIFILSLNLLTKLGFSCPEGAKSVFSSLKKCSIVRRETSSFYYSLFRLFHRGPFIGESSVIIKLCQFEDSQVRVAILRFFNAIAEMPGNQLDQAESLSEIRSLGVEEIAKKVLRDIVKEFREEFHTQSELLVALLGGKHKSGSFLKDSKESEELQSVNSVCVIPTAAVTLKGVIGSGSFGTVHLGVYRGASVAVKCLHRREDKSEDTANVVLREAQALRKCQNHPHIVRFFGTCFEKDEVRLVFEFCELGSLETVVVNSKSKVSEMQVASYGKQTASGLAHLHALGVIHRDVAARNVLVDSRGICKVSDFGMARIKSLTHQNSNSGFVGKTSSSSNPLKWAAPESLRDRVFSRSSDSWMFAPFPSLDHFSAGCKVVFENLCPFTDDERGKESTRLMILCKNCFQRVPEKRPTMDTLIEKLDDILKSKVDDFNHNAPSASSNSKYDNW